MSTNQYVIKSAQRTLEVLLEFSRPSLLWLAELQPDGLRRTTTVLSRR